jgi:hypothetical protein
MTDPRLPAGADLHPSAPWNQDEPRLCVFCDSAEILNQEERILDKELDDDKAAVLIEAWKDENTGICNRCNVE